MGHVWARLEHLLQTKPVTSNALRMVFCIATMPTYFVCGDRGSLGTKGWQPHTCVHACFPRSGSHNSQAFAWLHGPLCPRVVAFLALVALFAVFLSQASMYLWLTLLFPSVLALRWGVPVVLPGLAAAGPKLRTCSRCPNRLPPFTKSSLNRLNLFTAHQPPCSSTHTKLVRIDQLAVGRE